MPCGSLLVSQLSAEVYDFSAEIYRRKLASVLSTQKADFGNAIYLGSAHETEKIVWLLQRSARIANSPEKAGFYEFCL